MIVHVSLSTGISYSLFQIEYTTDDTNYILVEDNVSRSTLYNGLDITVPLDAISLNIVAKDGPCLGFNKILRISKYAPKAAPTTVIPKTEAPTTTAAPTTVAPTTAPTTVAPTTVAPTTAAPTTAAPTTAAPVYYTYSMYDGSNQPGENATCTGYWTGSGAWTLYSTSSVLALSITYYTSYGEGPLEIYNGNGFVHYFPTEDKLVTISTGGVVTAISDCLLPEQPTYPMTESRSSLGGNPPVASDTGVSDSDGVIHPEGSEDSGFVTYYTNAENTTQVRKTFIGTRYHLGVITPAPCLSFTHYGIISEINVGSCTIDNSR